MDELLKNLEGQRELRRTFFRNWPELWLAQKKPVKNTKGGLYRKGRGTCGVRYSNQTEDRKRNTTQKKGRNLYGKITDHVLGYYKVQPASG